MNSLQIQPSTLRDLLSYDAENGLLTWLHRPFSKGSWNAQYSGKPALTADCGQGYRVGAVLGRKVYAHRVAWALHYGVHPTLIDHINGIRSDNRIENLRDVTATENARNACRKSNNTSGVNGVSWNKQVGRWTAMITVDRKSKYLGLFDLLDDAIAARLAEQAKHEFHPNHGRHS